MHAEHTSMLLSAHVIEGSAFGADSRTSAATTITTTA